MRETEPITKRRCDETGPRGCADQCEVGYLQPNTTRAGTLPQHNIYLEILHGGVENLLNRTIETMYLIDKQHISRLKIGENRRHVRFAFKRRTGCCLLYTSDAADD